MLCFTLLFISSTFLIPFCYSDVSVPSDLTESGCLQFSAGSTSRLRTEIPALSSICVDVPDIPADVRYIILQAHSQNLNVTLSYINSSVSTGNAISGTGIGLAAIVDGFRTETFWVFNKNVEDVSVILTLISYGDEGCNGEECCHGNRMDGTNLVKCSREEYRPCQTFSSEFAFRGLVLNDSKRQIPQPTVCMEVRTAHESYDAHRDPIAGGCNMEFPIEISPFLRVRYNRANTRLEFQHAQLGYPPGTPAPICSESMNLIRYKFYLFFLPERDFSESTFFKSMALMQDVSSIKRNGREVEPFIITPRTRAIFLSYPGQGVIFNIIAQSVDNGTVHEAAYTPAATYGCSFDSTIDGCGRLTGPFGKVLALVLAVCGLFVALRGHRYLTLEMAYFGFLAGALVSFVLLAKYASVTETDRDVLTVAAGVTCAIIWAAVWWVFGIPVLSVLLVGFELGFLLISVVYFTPLGDAELLRNDFNYWMILACGMLAVPVLLLPTTRMLSIIGSSIVGSYFIVVAVDRFTGSTLSYIVLNVVKRALSQDSSVASNVYPFQKTDVILSVLWVILSLFGTVLQRYLERSRAPFPPAPRTTWRREWQQRRERRLARVASLMQPQGDERTPLVGSSTEQRYDTMGSYNSR